MVEPLRVMSIGNFGYVGFHTHGSLVVHIYTQKKTTSKTETETEAKGNSKGKLNPN